VAAVVGGKDRQPGAAALRGGQGLADVIVIPGEAFQGVGATAVYKAGQ